MYILKIKPKIDNFHNSAVGTEERVKTAQTRSGPISQMEDFKLSPTKTNKRICAAGGKEGERGKIYRQRGKLETKGGRHERAHSLRLVIYHWFSILSVAKAMGL